MSENKSAAIIFYAATLLTVVSFVTAFALAYLAIFKHDDDLGSAAALTFGVTFVLGFVAAFSSTEVY